MNKYWVCDNCPNLRMRMGPRDSVLPQFLSVEDPYVEQLAALSPVNRDVLDTAILMGRSVVMVYTTPDGDHALVYPRGAFGENMSKLDKGVFWGLKGASDKLKTVYMEMEEKPEHQKKVRAMAKELDAMVKELDKDGWME